MAQNGSRPPGALRHTLRALRGRNYALYFAGHGLSLIGTWMQSVALGALVWKLTRSGTALGAVGFASQIFGFVLAPLAGVLGDRWDRRRTLLVTQALAAAQAIGLTVLAWSGVIEVWHVIALAAALGVVNAFDIPVRQAFVVQIVDRPEDLPNAIALNSFVFHGARLIGPVVAGVLIPLVGRGSTAPYAGETLCFGVNAVSYLAVLVALSLMRPHAARRPVRPEPMLASLRAGFRHAFGFPPIRALLLLLGAVSLVALPYAVLLPAVAAELHAGRAELPLLCLGDRCLTLSFDSTYGVLMGCSGLGALLGAVYLASRPSLLGLGRLIPLATALLGAALLLFALSGTALLSMGLLLVVGFGFIVAMAASNTILQTVVDDDKRGRVMSLYTATFLGTAPVGALTAGFLADHLGLSATLAIGGAGTLLAAAVFASRLRRLRAAVRPIYVAKGILPPDPDALP
jgi:MFS family permease